MTRPEVIALLQKIERMDKAVRAESNTQVQLRWFDLHNALRRMIQRTEVEESM